MDANSTLSSFDTACERCAVVTCDQRVKIFDVASSTALHTYTPDEHLLRQITCIAWTHSAAVMGKEAGAKKRKHGASITSGGHLLAVGNSDGSIVIWDVARAEVRCTLGGAGGRGGAAALVRARGSGKKRSVEKGVKGHSSAIADLLCFFMIFRYAV